MKIYLNGKFVEKEQAVVSVFDHGVLYGDGVFAKKPDTIILPPEESFEAKFVVEFSN